MAYLKTLKISTMSGKLEGIPAVNSNPLNNKFCNKMSKCPGTICQHCFSRKMLKTYRSNCVKSFTSNGDILKSKVLHEDLLPVFNDRYIRISAHGEMINLNHFINICNIAKNNTNSTFSIWTKRKPIIARYVKKYGPIPKNLIMIYSNEILDKIITSVPKNFNKVFNVITADSDKINCGSKKCIECLACYKLESENIIVEKLK